MEERDGAYDYVESELELLFGYIERYAREKELKNTSAAVELLREIRSGNFGGMTCQNADAGTIGIRIHHCLSVCHMLVDLRIRITQSEEDILLTCAICHVLPEMFEAGSVRAELANRCGIDQTVLDVVDMLNEDRTSSDEVKKRFFARLRENRTAMLVELADRGHLSEMLYVISGWSARGYIHETRAYYLPLCVYAKEHNPELLAPISVMMEKMRSLSEVAEILLSRYETRETELTQEILALQEENASIRRMISAIRENDA